MMKSQLAERGEWVTGQECWVANMCIEAVREAGQKANLGQCRRWVELGGMLATRATLGVIDVKQSWHQGDCEFDEGNLVPSIYSPPYQQRQGKHIEQIPSLSLLFPSPLHHVG